MAPPERRTPIRPRPRLRPAALCALLLAPFHGACGDTAAPDDGDTLPAPVLPAEPFVYAAQPIPAQFVALGSGGAAAPFDNTPTANPITDAGATLGRVLFYDRRLSVDRRVACASCHRQEHGFSDSARFSVGLNGQLTPRRSMALANARFYGPGRFFWDERAASLEAAVLEPIQDPREMGFTLAALTARLAATDFYPPLFSAAFGSPDVTPERIGRALAQFIRALVSAESAFDTSFDADGSLDRDGMTPELLAGFSIFSGTDGNCSLCHSTNAHITREPFNIGLDAATTDAGAGDGRFKVPSLRNIAVRAPYMHDGRFASLEEVIEHYDSGVRAHPALAAQLRDVTQLDIVPRRLDLSAAQKALLIGYLRSLTDERFLTDPRFADPFPAR